MTRGRLIQEAPLESLDVVANSRMNREREVRGGNSYAADLGFDVVELLHTLPRPRWLDVCCGSARALIQAEPLLPQSASLVGLDLVDHFWPRPKGSRVRLVVSPLRSFRPARRGFDLITCVHGLHYVGDKLGSLARLCSWLAPAGLFAAHLDLDHVIVAGLGRKALPGLLRELGLDWNARRHLVTARRGAGPPPEAPLVFEGAAAGEANYTGQPAVKSHYSLRRRR